MWRQLRLAAVAASLALSAPALASASSEALASLASPPPPRDLAGLTGEVVAPPLAAASGGEHLWFVIGTDRQRRRFDLCHFAADGAHSRISSDRPGDADPDPPHYRVQAILAHEPEAIAAAGTRVWLAFPSSSTLAGASREVFTAAVVKHAALGMYFSEPQGRLEALAPLPGSHRLAGFAAGAAGPLALIFPDASPPASAETATRPGLLQLRDDQWTEIPLPASFDPRPGRVLLAADAAGNAITLLASSPAAPDRSVRFDRSGDGRWRESQLALPSSSIRAVVMAGGEVYAATRDPGASTIEIVHLGPERPRTVATVDAPSGPWTLLAFGSNLRLMAADGEVVTLRSIQPLTGEIGQPQRLALQTISGGRIWQLSLVLGISLSVMLLLVIVRPAPKTLALPPGVARMPLLPRLAALLLDMLPAAAVTAALLESSLTDLLMLHPLVALSVSKSMPFLALAGLTIAHETAAELIAGRSLGKALFGGTVVTAAGGPPRAWQVLARNLVKLITLLLPPLAIIVLTHPVGLALHDLAARTVVVRATEPDEDDEQDEQDEREGDE